MKYDAATEMSMVDNKSSFTFNVPHKSVVNILAVKSDVCANLRALENSTVMLVLLYKFSRWFVWTRTINCLTTLP